MENTNHLALYRKWRPRTFDEVCGQEHITNVLKYETAQSKLCHAYLFCGSRGTGKTSCAKILAKAVNCLSPKNGNPCGECAACRAIDSGVTTDVLEMDAASNNGVENIRDIRDEVNFAPSDLKYRVYIIDEVHMLSASAFNALLKTLEEPPAHVIFILATTELQKLPSTIISRCQRFDFRRISMDALISRLEHVAREEGIRLDPEAAHLLARLAQGGMRDAISLLELCSGGGAEVTPERVNEAVGSVGREDVIAAVSAVARQDYDGIFAIIAEAVASSKDLVVFWNELMSLYRDMLVVKTTPDSSRYLDLTDTEAAQLAEAAALFSRERLLAHCRLLEEALLTMQRANAIKRTIAELTLIKMSDPTLDTSADALLARISKLEDALRSGAIAVTAQPAAVEPPAQTAAPTPKREKQGEPATVPAAPKAPKVEQPVPAPVNEEAKPATPVAEKRVLKTLRSWTEVQERVGKQKPFFAALLVGSRAYIDPQDRVLLRLGNPFALTQIQREGADGAIREALAAELGRPLRESDLIIEVKPVQSDGPDDSIFDEIDQLNAENQ